MSPPKDLLPWQRRFLRGLWRPDVKRAALSVARSNGKSFLAARLAADYMLSARRDSEVVLVASAFSQAKIVFRYAVSLLRAEGVAVADRKRWTFRDSTASALLRSRATGLAIRALGCDPRRAHGRVFGLAICDEPAQWGAATSEPMLSAVVTGTGKVEGSRVVAIGTRPASSEHWFSRWLAGEADYRQIHAARPDDRRFWMKTIRKANPSFDHLPALREAVLAQRDDARRNLSARPMFESLVLNMGTPDTAESLLIEPTDWKACEVEALPPRRGPSVWGVDLGGSAAFSAVVAYWPGSGRVEGLLACGGIPELSERARADNAGKRYASMVREGSLIVQAGLRVPDVGQLLNTALRRFGGPPRVLVADLFRLPMLRDALDASRVPPRPLVVRRTRWSEATEDLERYRREVMERRLRVAPSVAWRHSLAESRVVSDTSGNIRLAVRAEAGRRRRARTDLASAAVLAVAEGVRRHRRGAPRGEVRLVAVR